MTNFDKQKQIRQLLSKLSFEEQIQNIKDLLQETESNYGKITPEYVNSLLDNLTPPSIRDDVVEQIQSIRADLDSRYYKLDKWDVNCIYTQTQIEGQYRMLDIIDNLMEQEDE